LRFHIRLLGCQSEQQTPITEHLLVLPANWISGRSQADDESQNSTVEIPVKEAFSAYALHVTTQVGHCANGRYGFTPDEGAGEVQVTVKLSVGLRLRDVKRYAECSLRDAHWHIA
jgi:hypothetical protein